LKYSIMVVFMLIVVWVQIFAQNPDISVSFNPADVYVNTFRTASFDPETPWTQPIMTNLQIANMSENAFRFYMKVEIYWSGETDPLVQATYISAGELSGGSEFYPLTNQDIITNQASAYFDRIGSIDFSLDEIISRNALLKSAVLAGYFPDGVICIRVLVQPQIDGHVSWTDASVANFCIHVRTTGCINLIGPGAPLHRYPVTVADNPVSFLWNSLDTGYNNYVLTIREYPQNKPPDADAIGLTGSVFYQGTVSGYEFSELLPFKPDNYYAWCVSAWHYNEQFPAGSSSQWSDGNEGEVSSVWNVFRFVEERESDLWSERLALAIAQINDPQLKKLIQGGFMPLDGIVYQGRKLYGQDALNQLGLLGETFKVRIWDSGGEK
jgi:hypothetical protein